MEIKIIRKKINRWFVDIFPREIRTLDICNKIRVESLESDFFFSSSVPFYREEEKKSVKAKIFQIN